MVTPQEMREFAAQCERWASESRNASQHDLMMQIAKTWLSLANRLDHQSDAMPDLRNKLD